MSSTFFSIFDDFIRVHPLLSEKNNQRIYPRRFYFPLKKKNNVADDSNFAYLFFKRSATNFFVTLFAHSTVIYSCSSGIVGLVKKQRRWSNAAFLIGAHFFTFIKNYFSFRSGTSVYRNKPFGKVVVVLRSSIYFFTLFYMSFNRHYRYLRAQIKIRRKISYRAAYNEYLIINRNSAVSSGNHVRNSRTNYNNALALLVNDLSSTRHCSSVYFKHKTGWLHSTQCYTRAMLRSVSRAVDASLQNTFLRSTYIVAAPMCASFLYTSLSSFVSSYARICSGTTAISARRHLEYFTWHTYVIASHACTFYSGADFSFVSLLGSLYNGVPTEHVFLRMHTFMKSLYNNNNICMYAQSYYAICTSFSIYIYASYGCNMLLHDISGFKLQWSIRSIASFFFYNIVSSSVTAQAIFSGLLCSSAVSLAWKSVSQYLFVLNGFLFIRSFCSSYYSDLCLLLRIGFFAYNHATNVDWYDEFVCNYMYMLRDTRYVFVQRFANFVHRCDTLPFISKKASLLYHSVFQNTNAAGRVVDIDTGEYMLCHLRSHSINLLESRMPGQLFEVEPFLISQLLKHRSGIYTNRLFLHSTSVFLQNSVMTSTFPLFLRNVLCRTSILKICDYIHSMSTSVLVTWPFGYSALESVAKWFTSVTSFSYTVFLKCRMLSLLYSLFYSYSFFIEQDTELLSYVYFLHFFFAVFLRRWWANCFFSDVDEDLSLHNKTNSDFVNTDSYNDLFSFNYAMTFNIFMFIDQSTFPFNGCKGKKRN